MFQIVIYLEHSSSWSHNAINEFQAGCIGFPKGLCGSFDILIKPALTTLWIFGKKNTCKHKNKNQINTNDFLKKGLILHINMSLIFQIVLTIHTQHNAVNISPSLKVRM